MNAAQRSHSGRHRGSEVHERRSGAGLTAQQGRRTPFPPYREPGDVHRPSMVFPSIIRGTRWVQAPVFLTVTETATRLSGALF